MPRRVIYIKNPSSGSNFRTIDGGGGSSPRPRPSSQPSNSQGGYGTQNPVGYAGNFTTGAPNWSNWYQNFPSVVSMPEEVFQGIAPSGAFEIFSGLTPAQFYQLQWDEHSGIDFWIWYFNTLAEGINPATGDIQPPLGTPGQFTLSGTFSLNPSYSQYGGEDFVPSMYWGTAGEGNPTAPANYITNAASLRVTGQPMSFQNAYQQYVASLGQ